MPFPISEAPAPFFTIVLGTYDRAHLISRAIQSVLAQSFSDWELLVIDDGSHDTTFEVVRPFVEQDARIRYHYARNRGISAVRNLGLQMALGSYVGFLDSDDTYHADHLSLRAEYLRLHPEVELLHGGVEVIGPATVADKNDPSRQIPLADCVIGGTFVIRRSLAEQLNGFRLLAYSDDSDFFERALALGAHIEKVQWPTYRYNRLEPDSLCNIIAREGEEGIARYRNSSTSDRS